MPKKSDSLFKQRNKYLDDLGIPFHDYGVNWTLSETSKQNRRKWNKQREKYGFDDRETYCLNDRFAEWLYSHQMMYRKKAGCIVDLTYHMIDFEGETYTQLEAINKTIEWTAYYLRHRNDRDMGDECEEKLQRATRLWAELLPYAWW